MTIALSASGETFEGQLEEDEFHMLWIVQRHRRTGKRQMWFLLSAALKNGCQIVDATPVERVLLEAHGYGSGRAYTTCRQGQCRASRGGRRL